MIADLSYSLGQLVGTGIGVLEARMGGRPDPSDPPTASDSSNPSTPSASSSGSDPTFEDDDLLVNSILGAAVGWVVKKTLRPRSVSWPRVVVAGIGATVVADVVGRAVGPSSEERDRAYDEDPDALLVRIGAGIAMAAGYAALLYPRLPGSPMTRGLIFGAMEVATAPHGGLVRVATDTPGLKFPLKDLAVPIDERAGPLANMAFGLSLGLLYRPSGNSDG